MTKKIVKKAKEVLKADLSNLDDFSEKEIAQLANYGKALHTATDFDEEVERELEKLDERKERDRQTAQPQPAPSKILQPNVHPALFVTDIPLSQNPSI